MPFGFWITVVSCGLWLISIAIHWLAKWFNFDDFISVILLPIGLVGIPLGLIIWVLAK